MLLGPQFRIQLRNSLITAHFLSCSSSPRSRVRLSPDCTQWLAKASISGFCNIQTRTDEDYGILDGGGGDRGLESITMPIWSVGSEVVPSNSIQTDGFLSSLFVLRFST